MNLPENKRVKRNINDKINVLIYGKSGTGKTYFTGKLPNSIIYNTDGNISEIDTPNYEHDRTWKSFGKFVDLIYSGKHTYEWIICDLGEDIHSFSRIEMQKEQGVSHESDLGYGKGWDVAKALFFKTMGKLLNSKYKIIVLCHEKEVTTKNRVGIESTSYQPNLQASIIPKMMGFLGLCVRVLTTSIEDEKGNIKTERIMHLRPQSNEVGINRFESKIKADVIKLDTEEFLKAINLEATEEVKEVSTKKDTKAKKQSRLKRNKDKEIITKEVSKEDDIAYCLICNKEFLLSEMYSGTCLACDALKSGKTREEIDAEKDKCLMCNDDIYTSNLKDGLCVDCTKLTLVVDKLQDNDLTTTLTEEQVKKEERKKRREARKKVREGIKANNELIERQ